MEYWNDCYWASRIEKSKDKMDFLSEMWVDKYKDIIKEINVGTCLDLGCGLGQFTKYFYDLGFDCTSVDISPKALENLKDKYPFAKVKVIDMSKGLPFKNQSFDLVFANLSIHYFDLKTTKNLLQEIKRILKPQGYFIGSVNSTKTFKFIKDNAIKIEDNYYKELDRYVRLWDEKDFEKFFGDFKQVILEEVTTTRWKKPKIMWEFIYKND